MHRALRFSPLRLAPACVAVLLVSPVSAENDRATKLLELIRANGCQMTTAEASGILPAEGFTPDQTRSIIRDWDKKGWLDSHGFAGIKLSRKGCKG